MATIVKVTTDAEGGVPVDTVESLLDKSHKGEDLIVFGDDGSIIYAATGDDDPHDFEEV